VSSSNNPWALAASRTICDVRIYETRNEEASESGTTGTRGLMHLKEDK